MKWYFVIVHSAWPHQHAWVIPITFTNIMLCKTRSPFSPQILVARMTCHNETGFVGEFYFELLLVTPINMFLTQRNLSRRERGWRGMHRTDFYAFKSILFNGREIVLAKICVPVATARSAGIWLKVAFLFLFATRVRYQSSWDVMILLWPPVWYCTAFPSSAVFFNH